MKQRVMTFWRSYRKLTLLMLWVSIWARYRQSLMAEFREPFTDLFGDTEILVKAYSFAVYGVVVAWPLLVIPLLRRATIDVIEEDADSFPFSVPTPVFVVGAWFVVLCFGIVYAYVVCRGVAPFFEEEILGYEKASHFWVTAFSLMVTISLVWPLFVWGDPSEDIEQVEENSFKR